MTLHEYLSQSPVTFAKWFLRDKEATCVDEDTNLFAGMQTSVVLFRCDDDGCPLEEDENVHDLDGSEVTPELAAELEAAMLLVLTTEVNEDGNPINI